LLDGRVDSSQVPDRKRLDRPKPEKSSPLGNAAAGPHPSDAGIALTDHFGRLPIGTKV
jgi:hypothetical protein